MNFKILFLVLFFLTLNVNSKPLIKKLIKPLGRQKRQGFNMYYTTQANNYQPFQFGSSNSNNNGYNTNAFNFDFFGANNGYNSNQNQYGNDNFNFGSNQNQQLQNNYQGNGYMTNQPQQNYGYTTPSSLVMGPDFRPQPDNNQYNSYNSYDSMIKSSTSSTTTSTKTTTKIPLITIESPQDSEQVYSKSFDPYAGMTTRPIPYTPQALWYSRYADFSAPIAAIPYNNYRNW